MIIRIKLINLRKQIFRILILLFLQCLIAIGCDDLVLSHPEVGLGLEYQHWRDGNIPWSIHILKIDRLRDDLKLKAVLAQDKILGLAHMSSIIASMNLADEKPVAGVNGDFFIIDKKNPYRGDPIGIQISDGELISEPSNISFWIDKNGNPNIEAVKSKFRAILPDGNYIDVGLNRERKDSEAVIYNSRLGDTTKTNSGMEFILECKGDNWDTLKIGKRYIGKIVEINVSYNTLINSEIGRASCRERV